MLLHKKIVLVTHKKQESKVGYQEIALRSPESKLGELVPERFLSSAFYVLPLVNRLSVLHDDVSKTIHFNLPLFRCSIDNNFL